MRTGFAWASHLVAELQSAEAPALPTAPTTVGKAGP